MVTISEFEKRRNAEGKEFFVLILSGDIDLVKSTLTGNFYATSKKTSITTTFDEKTCKSLIGRQIPGTIKRVECEPWQSVNQSTGELITHNHRWTYVPEGETEEENVFQGQVVEAKDDLFD